MFQWSYLFLYVGLGFGVGVTHNRLNRAIDIRPIDSLAPIIGFIFWGAVIWNLITFGLSWAALSFFEGFIGYFLGQKVRYSGHFH